jgi:hypothetical protein
MRDSEPISEGSTGTIFGGNGTQPFVDWDSGPPRPIGRLRHALLLNRRQAGTDCREVPESAHHP